MSDVFISYKAEDRRRVRPLVEALQDEGLAVWWDEQVGGGEAWREKIAEELETARCVIVAWSKRSIGPEGRFVRDEATRAQRRGTYLPVTIDAVEPPLGFGEMQAISLTGWKGKRSDRRYRSVSDRVHSLIGRPRAPQAHPRAARAIDRRTALAGGVAAMAVAAGAGWYLLRPSGAKANTVAVLPFANLSGDPSQNYFSDGIAEELRNALSAAGGLQVVARTSSEMLRNADAVSAARRLGVANVITGSVRRSPSTVRVSAQLVDGQDGLEKWSQTFDRPFGDVLKIQSDIASNVARALSIRLRGGGRAFLTLGGTNNPEAQDLLLQATALEGNDSSSGLLQRIALLDKATSLDPNYAEAHAKKSTYQTVWGSTWAAENAEKIAFLNRAFASARRAIALQPEFSMGHAALGLVYTNRLEMKAARDALQRSLALPGAGIATFINYATLLSRMLRQAEAEATIERAVSMDPLSPGAWSTKSWILLNGRRFPESSEAARHALSIAPQQLRARTLLAWNLFLLGRSDLAQRELQRVPADDYRRLVGEAAIAARANRKQEALAVIETVRKRYRNTAEYQVAEIYGQMGDRDNAIKALQNAWTLRDPGLAAIKVDPFLDPVRNDPRFAAIEKRVFG